MEFHPCTDAVPLSDRPAMQQHPNYAATIRKLGGIAEAYKVRDGRATLARVQVIRRKLGPVNISWVPRGPDWAGGISDTRQVQVLQALRQTLSHSPIRLITAGDGAQAQMLKDLCHHPVAPAQTYALLDLKASASDRLARQHGKWRNRLRHAQKAGTRVSTRPFQMLRDAKLLHLEQEQRRKLGYKALPPAFTQAWALANRKAAQLFLAQDDSGVIGFLLILLHPPTATYHIGWSNARGRALSCHNLLLWHASNWLAKRGLTELDLGLADPVASPGLTRFKTGIGATLHQTGPTMLAIPRLPFSKLWARAA